MVKIPVKHQCGHSFKVEVYNSPTGDVFDPARCPECGDILTNAAVVVDEKPDILYGFDWAQAEMIVRDYACSMCYGDLRIRFGPVGTGLHLVECPTHGNVEEVGRVTKAWLEKMVDIAKTEGITVRKNLADLFDDPDKPKKSESDILKELGFG